MLSRRSTSLNLGLHWYSPLQARWRWRQLIDTATWQRLLDRGSLTQRVQQQAKQHFQVELLGQCYAKPSPEEVRYLGLSAAEAAIVREVKLLADGQPLVFAHTIIPASSVAGRYRHLLKLGNRPLGAALFSDPKIVRGEVELCCLRPGDTLWAAAAVDSADCIWGRRSAFYLSGKPILVSEFFLPGWA